MPTILERAWPVSAVGRMSVPISMIPDFRRRIQSELTSQGLPSNLRNADDQSVLCVAAVQQAVAESGLGLAFFREWGVVGAPRSLGRNVIADALTKYAHDGAWSVSPHIVPQLSLHSVSGLVSVTFGFRGPNFGVGGVDGRDSDPWTALIAFDASMGIPGTWLVSSCVDSTDTCRAIALAISFQQSQRDTELVLRFGSIEGEALTPPFTFASFDRVLQLPLTPRSYCRWSLKGGGSIEWRRREVPMRKAA